MVVEQEKRAVHLFRLPQPGNRFIGHQVRDVTRRLFHTIGTSEHRVVVGTLLEHVVDDIPVIKPHRIAVQVPFTNDSSLIARPLQKTGERLLLAIEGTRPFITVESVCVAVEAGEQCRSARSADRIPDIGAIKSDTARCNAVNIGGLH